MRDYALTEQMQAELQGLRLCGEPLDLQSVEQLQFALWHFANDLKYERASHRTTLSMLDASTSQRKWLYA